MKRLVLATAVAAITLSGCSGTTPGAPVAPSALTVTVTASPSATTGTPLPTDTSASPAPVQEQWVPTESMSVDEIMRGAASDAWVFWSSDPEMPRLVEPSASPGDVTCDGTLPDEGVASYCSGSIHWDTSALNAENVARVPERLRHWSTTITAAHEAGHHIEGSLLGPKLTYQQHEDTAECLAGVYMMRRFGSILSPEDMGTAYRGLGRDGVTPGMAVPEAFFDGLGTPLATSPRDAFRTCVSEWG